MIQPRAGLRPAPKYAVQVAAPPYDVLSTEEARQQRNSGRTSPGRDSLFAFSVRGPRCPTLEYHFLRGSPSRKLPSVVVRGAHAFKTPQSGPWDC